jgi:hypothetical protein
MRVECSTNDTARLKRFTKPFDSPPIHSQVRIANTGSRPDRDNTVRPAKMKLEIVNETEEHAYTLGVKIVFAFLHYGRAGKSCDLLQDSPP